METLEMVKKLIENPEKKYVSEKNTTCEMIAHIKHGCLFMENTSSGEMTSVALNREWEEVKEPVSFMEALELIKSGKIDRKTPFTLVGKPGYERERLDNILERLTDDYYADGIAKILLEGKFYIED